MSYDSLPQLTVGSLFAGIGGFDLGFERAGFRILFQVEIDEYSRRVLEKHWPDVARYGDIRTITALPYVDVICGGFPCQDISNAGRREGIDGERSSLWGEMLRCIGMVRPRYVVVENVAALLGRGMGRVLGDLSALGFDGEWDCIRASAVGAPHRRDRVWIVAYANQKRLSEFSEAHDNNRHKSFRHNTDRCDTDVADATSVQRTRQPGEVCCGRKGRSRFGNGGQDVADAEEFTIGAGLRQDEQAEQRRRRPSDGGRTRDISDAAISRLSEPVHAGTQRPAEKRIFTQPFPERSDRWAAEPDVGRVAHGISHRVDRLKGLGNALVPQIAEWIARRILEDKETKQ